MSLQVPAKTGGGTCGDTRHELVCLGRLERLDVKDYCHKELLCDSSGEYLELYMCVSKLSGVVNSVVLNVRRVILDTRKCIKGLFGDFVDCGACFRRPHGIFGTSGTWR